MIYIHIPFCRSFCTYCDFYSELACKGKDNENFDSFTGRILDEIDARRDEMEKTLGLNTLYIGGGTPSVLPLSLLKKIVGHLGYGPYEEFTVEVNPEDILEKGPEYASGLLDLGVNRISMGVQSLDDGVLRWMNRRHNAEGAEKAFGILRESGFDNISVDVIFGIGGLCNAVLADSIEKILKWEPEHISAYQLSIEEGSALAGLEVSGRYTPAEDEHCREQYDLICSRLSEAGYSHYEISNWALPGREAVHNSAYWRRIPYAGLGPGAHSLKGRDTRSWNSEELSGWTSDEEHLSEEEIREERLMLGLRTSHGVDGKRIPESDWFISDSIIRDIILS